jgi:hypothetical protein
MISIRYRSLAISLASLILLALILTVGIRIHGNWVLNQSVDRYQKEVDSVKPDEYAPQELPKHKNMAIWLKAGAGILYLTKEQRVDLLTRLMDVHQKDWTTADIIALKEILKQNVIALQVLERTNYLTESSFDLPYSDGYEMSLPPLMEFLETRKLLACKARLHLLEGQLSESVKTAKLLERIAASLGHESVVICGLVGQVSEKDYYNLIQEMLPYADPAVLQEFRTQLDHLQGMIVPVSRVVAAEGASLYVTLRDSSSKIEEPGQQRARIMRSLMKRQMLAGALELHRHYAQLSKQPYQKVQPATWEPTDYVQEVVRQGFAPNVGTIVERFQSTESVRILASAAIDLCLYASKNSSYPQDLTGFPEIRSTYTGETARYEVHSDGSATLSFPEADIYWDSRQEQLKPAKKPRFVWKLPPQSAFASAAPKGQTVRPVEETSR